MSDLDNLEDIEGMFKREVSPRSTRNRKIRVNALLSIDRAHERRAIFKSLVRSDATKRGKVPVTLAPVRGTK